MDYGVVFNTDAQLMILLKIDRSLSSKSNLEIYEWYVRR